MSVVPVYGDTHSAVPATVQVGMAVYGPQGRITGDQLQNRSRLDMLEEVK
jgi:hypothetical protein